MLSRVPTYISPEHIVIEILETVNLSEEILTVCKELKSKGYVIALDDVISKKGLSDLIPYVDIIKIDYISMDKKDIKVMIQEYQGKVTFLAEKIENREEYEEAKAMGFDYFQGYFFSKPVILTGKDIAPVPTNYFQLLDVLNTKDPDIEQVSNLIQQDLSISFKLLKLMNSGAFLLKNRVTSIKQAVVLLGLYEIKKLVTVLLMSSLRKTDNQTQLVQMSLTRANFLEQISSAFQIDKNSLYMFGMFSLIDTILNKDMNDIVSDLPITSELSDALLGKDTKYNQALLLVESIEYGRWDETAKLCLQLQLSETEIFFHFQKSTLATDKFFQIGEKSLTGA